MVGIAWRARAAVNLLKLLLLLAARCSCEAGTGSRADFPPRPWGAILRGHWALIMCLALLALLAVAAAKAVELRRQLHRLQSQLMQETGERQRSEAALCRSEERYYDLFEHLSLGLFQTTLDGKLMRVNPALAAEAGYESPHAMVASVSHAGREFYIPEFYMRPSCRAEVLSWAARNDGPISYEAQYHRKTGEQITARVTLRLVADEPNREPYLEGSLEDVTERKRALAFAEAQRDLGIQLSAASSLSKALPLCLEAAICAAGMDSGEIYLTDDGDARTAVLAEGRWFRPQCLSRMRVHGDLNATLLSAVDEPTYSHYQECEVGQVEGCDVKLGARAMIPITHEDHRIGWLVVKSHTLRRVPAFGRVALETIAAQIGSAIVRIQAQEALAGSQCQLKALYDSLNDFLLVVDSRGRILDANRPVVERLGYTKEELQGMRISRLYLPDVQLQPEAIASGVLGGERNFIFLPMVAKDGTVIPVETRLGLGSWDGQNVTIGLGRDLTERRKAEEQTASLREKTALLKEIHHRIKNNLQIICSLLSLQASRLNRGRELHAFKESQARVRAIALLHEKLYQSRDLSRIELGEYLGALAQDILRTYHRPSQEIRLRLEAEPAWLNQDTVMPCGLVVNELVTNSCKYAFPEGRQGEIRVSVQQGSDHTLVLRVGDNGVGLPPELDPRKTTTLGLQLVDDMVSQLKGSWEVESGDGTVFRIVFPAGKG